MTDQELHDWLINGLGPHFKAFCDDPASFSLQLTDVHVMGYLKVSSRDKLKLVQDLGIQSHFDESLRLLCAWHDPNRVTLSIDIDDK